MLTTVPCALSFATGCRPASTSWTVPWILAAQPGNDAISTSAAIADQLRFLIPVSSPCEEGSAGIRLRSLLHSRREAGTGPSTALRTGRGCLTDDRRAWPGTPERHSFGPRWHGESRTGTAREELDWTGALWRPRVAATSVSGAHSGPLMSRVERRDAERRVRGVEKPLRQQRTVVLQEPLELRVEDIGDAVVRGVAARAAVGLHERLRRLHRVPARIAREARRLQGGQARAGQGADGRVDDGPLLEGEGGGRGEGAHVIGLEAQRLGDRRGWTEIGREQDGDLRALGEQRPRLAGDAERRQLQRRAGLGRVPHDPLRRLALHQGAQPRERAAERVAPLEHDHFLARGRHLQEDVGLEVGRPHRLQRTADRLELGVEPLDVRRQQRPVLVGRVEAWQRAAEPLLHLSGGGAPGAEADEPAPPGWAPVDDQ